MRIRKAIWHFRTLPDVQAKRTRGVFYALGGAMLGFAVLHPFSMVVFSRAAGAGVSDSLRAAALSFGLRMWPMWLWYGGLGATMGWGVALIVNRARVLEGLVPICAWCGKIRLGSPDDPEGVEWKRLDWYLQEKGVKETGTICPDCMPWFLGKLEHRQASATQGCGPFTASRPDEANALKHLCETRTSFDNEGEGNGKRHAPRA